MADVFVSYARHDKARVAPLVAAIEAKGWSVWWDWNIPAGKAFRQVIQEQLAQLVSVREGLVRDVALAPDLLEHATQARLHVGGRTLEVQQPG